MRCIVAAVAIPPRPSLGTPGVLLVSPETDYADEHAGGPNVEVPDVRDWPLPIFAQHLGSIGDSTTRPSPRRSCGSRTERSKRATVIGSSPPGGQPLGPGVLKNAIDSVFSPSRPQQAFGGGRLQRWDRRWSARHRAPGQDRGRDRDGPASDRGGYPPRCRRRSTRRAIGQSGNRGQPAASPWMTSNGGLTCWRRSEPKANCLAPDFVEEAYDRAAPGSQLRSHQPVIIASPPCTPRS